jgi:hypothetical protein
MVLNYFEVVYPPLIKCKLIKYFPSSRLKFIDN